MKSRFAFRLPAAFLAIFLVLSLPLTAQPKNVILIIGDGMGVAHFTAARFLRGKDFRIGTMPVTGLIATSAANRVVTDSAASGSGLATGVRTNYRAVSITPAGKPVVTVLEAAEGKGRATGLVTTAAFYDATPAAFAAHAKNRYHDPEIIEQMLRSGAEIIVGSGAKAFGKDGLPPLDEAAAANGYAVESTLEGLRTSSAPKVLGLFKGERRDRDFRNAGLPDLTRVAIERLSKDPDGFFLLVEHEGTDSGSHANDSSTVQASLMSVDAAAGVALDFAAADGETLVVVLADHETGGLRLSRFGNGRFRMRWSTTRHTAAAVPMFAFGPGAEAFGGFQDNEEVGRKLLATQQ